MNAAHSAIKEHIKKANNHANIFHNQELFAKLDEMEATILEKRRTVDTDTWVTNTLVHYNPQYSIAKSELFAAIKAMEEFCSCFECCDCHTLLFVTITNSTPTILRCRCGEKYVPDAITLLSRAY